MYRFITLWGVIGGSGDRSRNQRSRLATCLAGLAVVAALAAGCGGSDGGTALPPLTPSATASSSTPSTSPTHETKHQELAAAKAVVRRYYAVLNNLHRDMNARALFALFTKDCACREQARAVKHARARGEHYIDHVRLLRVSGRITGDGLADVFVTFDAARGGLVDRNGRHITSAPPQSNVKRAFVLERTADGWRIAKLEVL